MKAPLWKALAALCIAFLGIALPAICRAQYETGSITGTVSDTSGAVIPNANITVLNLATGIKTTQVSDSAGIYRVRSLQVGTYKITADKEGFATAVADRVLLSVATTLRIDLALHIGATEQVVEVKSSNLAIQTETSERSQIVTQQQISAFPLKTLEYSDLISITAGITADPGQTTSSASLVRVASYNVNGQRSMYNDFLLDGVDNNAHGTSNQGFSNQVITPPPDSIAQFEVVTNNQGAEYGRASGGTVNVATKSGANDMHFVLYNYLRNTVLNAQGYFKSSDGKPTLIRNQFGGNIGGPILKNKAFFFIDAEDSRQTRGLVTHASIPTTYTHQLIMSPGGTGNIINPYTGDTYPANAPLPRAILSPIALAILDGFPLPNSTGVAATSYSNNWTTIRHFTDFAARGDLRLDYQWNSKTSSFVRLSANKENALDGPVLPEPYDGNSNGNQSVMNEQMVIGVTRQVHGSQLLDIRIGVSYTKGGKKTQEIGRPETFGIKGLPTDPSIAGGLTTMAITNYTRFGRQSTNPQWQYPFLFDPKVSYSWLMGRHSITTGYEFQYGRQIDQDVNPLYGLYTFNGGFSGNVMSDFLFGAPSKYAMTSFFVAHLRNDGHYAYIQDNWKASNRLTINAGLRYDYASHYWEKDNHLSNFDPNTSPTTGKMLQATNGSIYDKTLVKPDRNDFAPRIGLAFAIRPTIVLHASFGISYSHYSRNAENDVLAVNAPQAIFAIANQVPAHPKSGTGTPTSTFYTIDDGYPSGFASAANFNPYLTTVTYNPKDYRDPYVESFFLNIQKQLGRDRTIDIAYVGNHGVKIQEMADLNQGDPDTGRSTAGYYKGQYNRPYPTWGPIIYAFNGPSTRYNGMQVRFEQRQIWGLTVLNSFNWSRAFDYSSAPLLQAFNNSNTASNRYNVKADYGPSEIDHPLMNVTSIVYDLPLGVGRKWANNQASLIDQIIGGWQGSVIGTMRSGNPLNVVYSPSAVNSTSLISSVDNGAPTYRPWRVAGKSILAHAKGNPTLYMYNNSTTLAGNDPTKAAFTATNSTGVDTPYGDVSRNIIRSDPYYNVDIGINKTFKLPQHLKLAFSGQLYNAFNKTNFNPPASSWGSASFGVITGTAAARVGQFALKLIY